MLHCIVLYMLEFACDLEAWGEKVLDIQYTHDDNCRSRK